MADHRKKEEKVRRTDEPIAPVESLEHLQAGAQETGGNRPPGEVYKTKYGPGHTTDPQLAAEQGLTSILFK